MFHVIAYGGITIASMSIVIQFIYVPLLLQRTETSKNNVKLYMQQFKELEEQLAPHREARAIMIEAQSMCKQGRPGQRGIDGKEGQAGKDGGEGARGMDARDMLAENEHECIICPQGDIGPMGAPGERGEQGEKGNKGMPGMPAIDGIDGSTGPEGDIGPPGYAGHTGHRGVPGKSAEGGIGEPGPKGSKGPVGRAGSQGPRGKRNYIYGPAGPPGQMGSTGLDGMPGNPGDRGAKGDIGEKGADAEFCPCPMELQSLQRRTQGAPPSSPSSSTSATTTVAASTTHSSTIQSITTTSEEPKMDTLSADISVNGDVGLQSPTHQIVAAPGSNPSNSIVAERPSDELTSDNNIEQVDIPTDFGSEVASQQLPVNWNEEEEEEIEEVTTTRRRFQYVTKRPRKYN